jgi:hypothetical protein
MATKLPVLTIQEEKITESNQKPRGIDDKAASVSIWSMGLVGGRLMPIINFLRLSV